MTLANNQGSNTNKRPDIVHLLRTAQQHQVQLSLMADQKAHILIGSSLILLTLLYTQFEQHGISLVLLLLIATAAIAAACAILAVLPKTQVTHADHVDAQPLNLLFFGHFQSLSQAEYEQQMLALIAEEEQVYRAMIQDIYQIGCVLKRKYRYLGYSYRIFLYGLLATLLALVGQVLTTGLA